MSGIKIPRFYKLCKTAFLDLLVNHFFIINYFYFFFYNFFFIYRKVSKVDQLNITKITKKR